MEDAVLNLQNTALILSQPPAKWRMTKQTITRSDSAMTTTILYVYDGQGRLTRITEANDYTDPAKLTDMAKDLVHLHFARVLCRVIPKDFGEDAGYVPFLQAIKAGGYEGAISIEANCPDEFYKSAKQGLDVLRAACTKAGF